MIKISICTIRDIHPIAKSGKGMLKVSIFAQGPSFEIESPFRKVI